MFIIVQQLIIYVDFYGYPFKLPGDYNVLGGARVAAWRRTYEEGAWHVNCAGGLSTVI